MIRSIRLAHARKMLLMTDLHISEIAYEVGFSTPSYFNAVFVEEFGMSPSDLRRQHRSIWSAGSSPGPRSGQTGKKIVP